MPAQLVANEAIPDLAAQMDSPILLRFLRQLRHAHFIHNHPDLDQDTRTALQRLTDLGLIDPGYTDLPSTEPFIWVGNGNGERVLQYIEKTFSPKLKIHSRARTALASLAEVDREAVIAAVEALLMREPAAWTGEEVVRLALDRPVYLLEVSPDLRAFVTVPEEGRVELADIVGEETLRLFLERSRDGARVQ